MWFVQADPSVKEGWRKRVVFQDNGKAISTASTAVLVGIDPKGNGGRKQGWLFVTGPMSENVVVARIDL